MLHNTPGRLPLCLVILLVLVCGSCGAVVISGHVRDVNGVGMTGITIRAGGGASTSTTTGGAYSFTVTAPFTGMVGPEGSYQFSPMHYEYTGLSVDVSNQDFIGSPLLFGSGHLSTMLSYYSVERGAAVWGDYNNTGTLDAAAAGHGVTTNPPVLGPAARVFRGDGQSNFSDTRASVMGVQDAALAWGDYDNDGRLDLVVAGDTGSAYVTNLYRGNGSSFSLVSTAGLPGVTKGSVAWADYDNDGKLDLLIAGDSAIGRIAKLYHNNGDGTFTEDTAISLPGLSECCVAWADYDNDGRQDFAIAGNTGGGYVTQLYHNDGAGQFSEVLAALTGLDFASLAWGDYDNDGRFDLAIAGITANGSRITHICRNTGSGFLEQDLGLPGVKGCVAWGDYDNDGRIDLAIAGDQNFDDCPKVYHNNGNSTFTGYLIENVEITDAWAAWGDFGADGRLDIVVAGHQTSIDYPCTYVYQSQTAAANTAPSSPTGLASTWSNGSLTMSWSAATDTQTPQSGLSYNIRVGTSPGAGDVFSGMADYSTGYRRVPAIGNAGKNLSWTLTGLPARDYYWSVQAIDSAFAGSAWATEAFLPDPTPPVISLGAPSASLTNVGPVTCSVTYLGAYSITLAAADISLIRTGTANGVVTVSGTGLSTRTITISNITGDGTLAISIAPGTATNNSGSCLGVGPTAAVTVDNDAPTIALGALSGSVTKHGPITCEVTYGGADAITLEAGDVTLAKTGTADGVIAIAESGSTTRTLTISGITGDGTLGISIASGTAHDAAGNAAPAAASGTCVVDNTAPTLPTLSVSPQYANGANVTASFGGSSDTNGVTYKLKLDAGVYVDEVSPKALTISSLDEGPHTVYAKAVDPAGNESAEAHAEFTRDTTAPTINYVWFEPFLISVGDPVKVYVEAGDAVGVASVTAEGAPLHSTDDGLWMGSLTAAAGLGPHDVAVIASDQAGNTTRWAASYITVRSVAINNRAAADTILNLAGQNYVFTVWGRVSVIDLDSFSLDDGSGLPVRVYYPVHGLADGDYASARGALDVTNGTPTLIASVVTRRN